MEIKIEMNSHYGQNDVKIPNDHERKKICIIYKTLMEKWMNQVILIE